MTAWRVALLVFWLWPTLAGAAGKEALRIVSGGKAHDFAVELALTPQEQAKGLMFRENVPDMTGMLFYYEEERRISMWMKNTLIPLDMLFIAKNGEILAIHANAAPRSLAVIAPDVRAAAVLEIAGGAVRKLSLRVGGKVRHRFFTP